MLATAFEQTQHGTTVHLKCCAHFNVEWLMPSLDESKPSGGFHDDCCPRHHHFHAKGGCYCTAAETSNTAAARAMQPSAMQTPPCGPGTSTATCWTLG